MLFQKRSRSQKPDQPSHEANLTKSLSYETMDRIALELRLGCGMLPLSCFPYGIWSFD